MATNGDAVDLVLAKLRRRPQDRLQAAVVLEAWVGRKAPDSFDVSVGYLGPEVPAIPPGRSPRVPFPLARLSDFAVLATTVAIAVLWIPLLRPTVGAGIDTTIRFALPLALAVDGGLRVRYLGAGSVRSLGRPLVVVNAIGVVAAVVAAVVHPPTALVLVLVGIWGQASVLSVRRWFALYLGLALAATLGLWWAPTGLMTLVAVVGAGLTMAALVSAAVLTEQGWRHLPEKVPDSLAAVAIGGGSGLVLGSEPAIWHSATLPITVAALTVTGAAWLGSNRLTRLWVDLPGKLADSVLDGTRPNVGGGTVGRAIAVSMGLTLTPLVLITSVVVVFDLDWELITVAAFTCFAVAMLMIGLGVATRRWIPSALITLTGAGVALLAPFDQVGLAFLCGSGVMVVASVIMVRRTFTYATMTFVTQMMMR